MPLGTFLILYKLISICKDKFKLIIYKCLSINTGHFCNKAVYIFLVLLTSNLLFSLQAAQKYNANTTRIIVGDNPKDPWERTNRPVQKFNDSLDNYLLLPLTRGYDFITPDFMQVGATNFFNNVQEPYIMLNDALQLKMVSFYKGLARVSINSVIGLFGLVDVASHMGLERHSEDLGQTLGVWGLGPGPYVELPFLGPSTARDSVTSITEFFYAPRLSLLELNNSQRWTLTFVQILNNRNRLRQTERIIIGDRYTFIRDAYLQNRQYQVLDGEVPWDEYELEEIPDDLDLLDKLDNLDNIELPE